MHSPPPSSAPLRRATTTQLLKLLQTLGAPPRLLQHHRLVLEAAAILTDAMGQLCTIDAEEVLAGAAVHDCGKILHPQELTGAGSQHEPDGRTLLLKHGVAPQIARHCVLHARWRDAGGELEPLVVALADKLWKGKRVPELEEQAIQAAARRAGKDFWETFMSLDAVFEHVAAPADDRLSRSIP